MKRFLSAMLVAAGALGFGGCGIFETTQTGVLVPISGSIQDVPVPAGFKYNSDGSWAKVDNEAKTRSAVQNFRGKASLMRVAEFYKDQLPKQKWTETTVNQRGDQFIIAARKGNENVTITAWDAWWNTQLCIELNTGK